MGLKLKIHSFPLWVPGLILCLALWISASRVLQITDRNKPAGWYDEKLTYLPSGEFLKPMLLGFDQATASLLWVKAMMYFADSYLEGRSYHWLGHMLDIVIILDPQFKYPYQFGGLILAENQETLPKAINFMQRGIRQFPKQNNLRIFAAMAQLSLDSNYNLAARYLKPIIHDQKAPIYMRSLASTMLEKSGGKDLALEFLMQSYLASQSSLNKEFIVRKIGDIFEYNFKYSGL